MPNFERLRTVLCLEGEPDRIPFIELGVDPEIMEAVTGEVFRNTDIKNKLRVTIKFYSKLGYDYILLIAPTLLSRNNILSANDTAEMPSDRREWQDEHRGVIETREQFDRYPWPDLDNIQEIYLPQYEFVKDNMPDGMMILTGPECGVLENVMRLMGTVPFFKALYKDTILIQKMFEKVGTLISSFLGLAAELDMVGGLGTAEDMGYKTGLMFSPEILRKYVFPWQKRCVDAVHKHAKPFILHSCGNLKLVMDDLIDYVGIDAKHSYEDSSYPVTEYKRTYGHRIAILGGIDMDKLSRMPKKEFQVYVREIIRECAPGGGYALGSGNTIANFVKLENYLTMLKIGRKYGKY
jgi:uroporphyrinogen decarboxylase